MARTEGLRVKSYRRRTAVGMTRHIEIIVALCFAVLAPVQPARAVEKTDEAGGLRAVGSDQRERWGENPILALAQPAEHQLFQYRLATGRAESFAMNDANAALGAGCAVTKKTDDGKARFVTCQAVQIELGLDDPAAAP